MVLSSGLTLTVNCDTILIVIRLNGDCYIMKRLALAALCMVGVFALSGCGDNVTLTEEQNDMIAEYVAGSLLKHSYDNEWKYTKLNSSNTGHTSSLGNVSSTAAGMTTATKAGTVTATTAAADVNTTASSLSQALGLSGVEVKYKAVSIGERYPTEAYAVCVPADSGCKVVAVEFTIKNTGSAAVTATTKSSSVTMKLNIGGGTYNQYKSMLKNDICGLDGVSIKPGDSYTAAAIFQVPAESAVKSSDMKMEVLSGSKTVETITLQ